jgi:hypothetical protein
LGSLKLLQFARKVLSKKELRTELEIVRTYYQEEKVEATGNCQVVGDPGCFSLFKMMATLHVLEIFELFGLQSSSRKYIWF